MYIKQTDFNKRFITPIQSIHSKLKTVSFSDFLLPTNSAIHFLTDDGKTLGPDNTLMLTYYYNQLYVYHITQLQKKLGNFSPTKDNPSLLIRNYQKRHKNFRLVNDLDRFVSNNKEAIILNYSMLPQLYKYTANNLQLYQEWYNLRFTIWDMINQLDTRVEHFLIYKLPKELPPKIELIKAANIVTPHSITYFHDTNQLNLIELWRFLTPTSESMEIFVSEEAIERVNLLFIESGTFTTLKLSDLLNYGRENDTRVGNDFYTFLEHIVNLRKPTDLNSAIKETEEEPIPLLSNERIVSLIEEKQKAGQLSEKEANALLKLSQRYKTIKDPLDPSKTLDQLIVTPEDLKLESTKTLHSHNELIAEGLTYSTVNDFHKKYVESVMHKDIVNTVLSFQQAGIIVKDINLKENITAVGKTRVYSVQVQPISGPQSTISFTIPKIDPDGTFTVGSIRYLMDTQKGDLPIAKTKSNTVALTSYYGKLFLVRNESSAYNFSKWILKQLMNKASDDEDHTVNDLVFGINKYKDNVLPRVFTAIAENITSFYTPEYFFYFAPNYTSIVDNKDGFKQLEAYKLRFCGIELKTNSLLGMDLKGTIFKLVGKELIELGPITYLIDSEMADGPIEYSELSLLNRRIPLVIALSYIYGLDGLLEKLNVKYAITPVNVRAKYKKDEIKIKFKDIIYIVDGSDLDMRLLFGGFESIKKEIAGFKGNDFNKRSVFSTMFTTSKITNYHFRELLLVWDLFLDPITVGLLKELDVKPDMLSLLLTANHLLIDDRIPDYNSPRYKGYERICGMLYNQLVDAVRTHRAAGTLSNVGVTLNPQAVYLDIIQDPTTSLVEDSNPIYNLKERAAFTHSGQGGRSTTTMVKQTRGYHEKDVGVISEATPDSSKVGIRAYLTPNAKLTSLRGTVESFDEKKDKSSSLVSDNTLLVPSLVHDDNS